MILYIILLIGLGTLGYFGADMYLPAFPVLQTYFGSNETAIGLTFSIYMFGITIGQLFYGVLSDRFGRKKVLCVGLFLFVIASVGCMLSESITTFTAWRLLQALGVCGPLVIWQAMVIDRFAPEMRHKIFAIVFPLLALSPALAPTVGGMVLSFSTWQMIFMVLIGVSVTLFTCVLFFLKETTTNTQRAASHIHFHVLKKKYVTLLTSPIFMGYICTLSFSSSAYFCYLTASPFILSGMGYSAVFIGLSYIPQTVGFVVGGLISKKITDKWGVAILRQVLYGFLFFAFLLLAVAMIWPLTAAYQIVIPFTLMAVLSGILYPSGMNLALSRFPELAGIAAGLAGSIQAFTAFMSTSILATILWMGAITMPVMIVILSLFSVLCYRAAAKSF